MAIYSHKEAVFFALGAGVGAAGEKKTGAGTAKTMRLLFYGFTLVVCWGENILPHLT